MLCRRPKIGIEREKRTKDKIGKNQHVPLKSAVRLHKFRVFHQEKFQKV